MLLEGPKLDLLPAAMPPGTYLTDGRRLFCVMRVIPEDADMETIVLLEDCRSLDAAGWSLEDIAEVEMRIVVPDAADGP